jgi:hypothetical protein
VRVPPAANAVGEPADSQQVGLGQQEERFLAVYGRAGGEFLSRYCEKVGLSHRP